MGIRHAGRTWSALSAGRSRPTDIVKVAVSSIPAGPVLSRPSRIEETRRRPVQPRCTWRLGQFDEVDVGVRQAWRIDWLVSLEQRFDRVVAAPDLALLRLFAESGARKHPTCGIASKSHLLRSRRPAAALHIEAVLAGKEGVSVVDHVLAGHGPRRDRILAEGGRLVLSRPGDRSGGDRDDDDGGGGFSCLHGAPRGGPSDDFRSGGRWGFRVGSGRVGSTVGPAMIDERAAAALGFRTR